MDKKTEKQLKKLATLENDPKLAIFDEINVINGKLEAIKSVLKAINSKEAKLYDSELKTLSDGLVGLKTALLEKDLVVNIPLNELSDKMVAVEQAIKNIKPVSIPEYPSEITLSETQINEILLEIQAIPEFPIKELEKMFNSLSNVVKEIKLEIPEEKEFDYERLEKKLSEVIKAVKNISISVQSGGNSIDENSRANLTNISNNTSSIAGFNIPKYDTQVLEYTGSDLTAIKYYFGGVLVANKVFEYTDGVLTSIYLS